MGEFLGVFSNNEVVAFARFVESVDTTNLSNALELAFDSQESFEERLQTCVKQYPHLEEVFCVMTKMHVFAGILQIAKVVVSDQKTENILCCLDNKAQTFETSSEALCIQVPYRDGDVRLVNKAS